MNISNRYLDHLCKLVDAIHLLNRTKITEADLSRAHILLISFVNEFEKNFGDKNMVYNIHQLRHLVKCVKKNGPLFAYSNYSMEDYNGHMVSFVKGTTDVTAQICSRYIMEMNLFISLKKSPLAQEFYEQIDSASSYSITTKIDGSLLIGNPIKNTFLSALEIDFIKQNLNIIGDKTIKEYRSVLLNCRVYYETIYNEHNDSHKRTDDSFVYNTQTEDFGVIKSILVANHQLFFLVDEKFKEKIENKNCIFVKYLEEKGSELKILKPTLINRKFALVKFEDTIAVSEFPNLFERH